MSDFGPAELDALEDALEDLEHTGAPHEGGPGVAQRLEEYREIMHWTRDAMPLVEVKPGLLDGVLEEARSVAPVALPSATTEAEPTSWWKRLRGVFVIPVVAVAGSAALVLLLFVPMASRDSDESMVVARGEPTPAATPTAAAEAKQAGGEPAGILQQDGIADASVDDELSRGRLRLEEDNAEGRAAAIEAAPAEELPAAPPAVEGKPEPSAEKGPPPKPAKAKPRDSDKVFYDDTAKSAGGGGAPAKEQAEAPAPGGSSSASPRADSGADAPEQEAQKQKKGKDDAGDAWSTIGTADRLRRAGNCAAAKPKYKSLATAIDRRIKARALAGLGLCEKDAVANDYFDKARKADPDITGFISHERGDEPANADQSNALE